MTSCIIKTAAPIVVIRAVVFIMQGFADILPHSDTAEGEHNVPDVLGMRSAVRSSRIAPRQENGTTKVVSFSFLKFFIFLLDK